MGIVGMPKRPNAQTPKMPIRSGLLFSAAEHAIDHGCGRNGPAAKFGLKILIVGQLIIDGRGRGFAKTVREVLLDIPLGTLRLGTL